MKSSSIKILFAAGVAALLSSCAGRQTDKYSNNARLVASPEDTKVEVMRLEEVDFHRQLTANGKAVAAARAELYFHTDGMLTKVNVQNGAGVSAGEIIAALDSEGKEIAVEAARLELDKALLELQNVLAGQGYPIGDTTAVPTDVLKMAKMRSGYLAAENSLRRAEMEMKATILRAPFSGRVANVKLHSHDRVGTEPFCVLIDDRTMNVEFSILESEYGLITRGMKARISPFANPEKELVGEIVSVNPLVDKSGQVTVRARVSNASGMLVDGMNVRVIVEKDAGKALVVPRGAVVIRDNMEVLFKYSRGRASWTYVNTLMSNGENFAVKANAERGSTLAPGDSVIISGNLNLADGSKVVLK